MTPSKGIWLSVSVVGLLAVTAEGTTTTLMPKPKRGFGTFAFFKNSKRRDPLPEEENTVVRLKGCTGFFVKNSKKKAYVMTARHCVGMSLTNWCNAGGKFNTTSGDEGQCKKVVAADLYHDIALFEASLKDIPTEDQGLELASFTPDLKQKLTMVGYPADKFRNAALTTTETCWITARNFSSPHGGYLNDRSAKHNCTTYGGNSGGPMIAEGTRIALGLPFTYYPDDYTDRSESNTSVHAYMAQMEDFVSVHRKELEIAGVSLASSVR